MDYHAVKTKITDLNLRQIDMIEALRKRGIRVTPSLFSLIINGHYYYPKADEVISACNEILAEYEKKKGNRRNDFARI